MTARAGLILLTTLLLTGCAQPATTASTPGPRVAHRYEEPSTGSLLGGGSGADDTRETSARMDPGLGGRNQAAGGH